MKIKSIITSLLISITTLIHGQTELDSLIVEKINKFRIQNFVVPLYLSPRVSEVARDHSEYCAKIQNIFTSQYKEIDSVKVPIPTIELYSKYFDTMTITPMGLIVTMVYDERDSMTNEQIAEHAFQNYIRDDETREWILYRDPTFVGYAHDIGNGYEHLMIDISTEEEILEEVIGKIFYFSLFFCDGLCE